MDPLILQLRDLLEQTEPYQRKVKAKHTRLKKRVISHGGQKAGPPYSDSPSMERSKSAPPIGEHIVKQGSKYCLKSKKNNKNLGCYPTKSGAEKREKQVQYFKHMKENLVFTSLEEGLWDDIKKRFSTTETQPQQADEYPEGEQVAKGYTFFTDKLAVGSAPINQGVFNKNALKQFDKIYIMSDQVADILKLKDPKTLENNKNKIILKPIADVDQPLSDQEAKELIAHDQELQNAIESISSDLASGKKILVTCSMGLNRSVTAACGALVKQGMSAEEAIKLAKQKRGEKSLSLPSGEHKRFINFINKQSGKQLEEMIRRVIRDILV